MPRTKKQTSLEINHEMYQTTLVYYTNIRSVQMFISLNIHSSQKKTIDLNFRHFLQKFTLFSTKFYMLFFYENLLDTVQCPVTLAKYTLKHYSHRFSNILLLDSVINVSDYTGRKKIAVLEI